MGGSLVKASDYIAEVLYAQGVRCVFEVAGGMITHLIDSIHYQQKIRLISVHHKQAAAFAAEASARVTGVPGVALATSGPGAVNLLTGIGSCYYDSTPAVFITGQVNTHEQRGDRPVRQLGFQETDIVTMAGPVTKAAHRVTSAAQLPRVLAAAFATATEGRPGPVLVDVPMDVQNTDMTGELAAVEESVTGGGSADSQLSAEVGELLSAVARAQRPLILVGGGLRAARARGLFREVVDRLGVPVVNSLQAVDALPYDHPLRVGLIGTYGNRWANLGVAGSDLLIVLGSRLDIRQTGGNVPSWRGDRAIYHVDCDAGEVGNRVTGCRSIIADLGDVLQQVAEQLQNRELPARPEWNSELQQLRRDWPDTAELGEISGINPNQLMHQLSRASDRACAFTTDVGQNQMWAAQSLELLGEQQLVNSGGMGAMGFGLPAAIGACIACDGRPVVAIAGDGGFQMNLQELQTVAHHGLPVKMVVVDNRCYGMVRQFQESYFEERYPSTYWGYSAPDFAAVAGAFGIAAHRVEDPAQAECALGLLWEHPDRPFLLQVMVDAMANSYPKLAFGRGFPAMEPLTKPTAL